MSIHPTAIIDSTVKLGKNVSVGPYSIIQGNVEVGDDCEIASHVVLGFKTGVVKIGKGNRIMSGAIVGGPPQDLKYKGEATQLIMGDNNMIREFVTINLGTPTGGGITQVGSNCLFMAYVHIAHDCHIGNHVVIANTTNLAGHVTMEDYVRVGGVCAFNQFVKIGKFAFIAGDSAVNKDIMPFVRAQGKYAVARATNSIGLERAGYDKEEVRNVYKAIRTILTGSRTMEEALKEIETECRPSENIQYLVNFIKKSERGIAR